MNYVYIREALLASDEVSRKLYEFATNRSLGINRIFIDYQHRTKWQNRKINSHILDIAKPNDNLIVHDATNLANSLCQVLEILNKASKKGITIHFEKYGLIHPGKLEVDTEQMLRLLKTIESDFITKRSQIAMAKRKAKGLHVGRPKGRMNDKLKLDPHKDEIELYLKHGISKIVIAKRLGCHAQTLYNYLHKRAVNAD